MLNKAKSILIDNNNKLVIINNSNIITSDDRGVKALLDLLDRETELSGAYAADRVVGKAAAMIYCQLGIRALYASVISEGARDILIENGITLEFEEVVPYIVNRSGDGMCPMEEAVGDERDQPTAIQRVRDRLKELLSK